MVEVLLSLLYSTRVYTVMASLYAVAMVHPLLVLLAGNAVVAVVEVLSLLYCSMAYTVTTALDIAVVAVIPSAVIPLLLVVVNTAVTDAMVKEKMQTTGTAAGKLDDVVLP